MDTKGLAHSVAVPGAFYSAAYEPGRAAAATDDDPVRLVIIWMSLKLRRKLTSAHSLPSGQIAQLVERSPEKAGVGGSNPSLATK